MILLLPVTWLLDAGPCLQRHSVTVLHKHMLAYVLFRSAVLATVTVVLRWELSAADIVHMACRTTLLTLLYPICRIYMQVVKAHHPWQFVCNCTY